MTLILAFIATHMGFLWDEARFRIAGSEVSTVNGGDALLVVESDVLRLQFVRDRGQLFLDFQPVSGGAASEWFSVDLLRRLMSGQPETSGLLDEGYAAFIGQNLDTIEGLFRTERWPETRAELKALEIKRAKELFG
ncbi:hypothetical protein ABZS29_36460 [Kribbella sp. NPDC005582]|uniref:hypothetical protein n=1 Tax=Kribbella sp. NPDC005582 TaxID=3156893 RepID=UPI0033AA32E2